VEGGRTHGSSLIYSGLSVGVFPWHDAPERSPVYEITFIQPSHAWLEYFGCETKAATEQPGGVKEKELWGVLFPR